SLALGILYAEGSRRYLESLSTYTRRRMTQAERADVDEVRYVPAALALHQRPGVPGIRSTFGTMTELSNSLRLMFSRLASHRCPNGHYVEPSFAVAAMQEITCPVCGEKFYGPGAEDLAFNSRGACPTCGGTGVVRAVNEAALVPNEDLTIDGGAVAVWGTLMWALMKDVCREMGVRTDVPFKDLTDKEKEIVYRGPAEKKHILYVNPKTQQTAEMDFTYYNAVYTVENALSKVKDDTGMKRLERFLKEGVCPDCHGTRMSEATRAPRLRGIGLDEASKMTLDDLIRWVKAVPASLPEEMRPMARNICESFLDTAKRLIDLGLGYLSLDRASSTLSTGERQRVQLARSVRNRTTGVLYVLDEPSIGLHPYNLKGLTGVVDDLIADGNSVVLVDHDTQVLRHSDYMVEMGKGAGAEGGAVIAEGTVDELENNENSLIGPYLTAEDQREAARGRGKKIGGGLYRRTRPEVPKEELFSNGRIHMSTDQIHTVHPLEVDIPMSRLTVVTGVSGSGKTTMVLESLIPGLEADIKAEKLPPHVKSIEAEGIRQVKLIDAAPIGINVRSTVATYAGVHDELRKVYAGTESAKRHGYKAGDFSYNTGTLRCPSCDGTGQISLDVQFLPDVDVTCPDCRGSRYGKEAHRILRRARDGNDYSLPDLMNMSVDEVLAACKGLSLLQKRLQVLHDLGLGYLTLGEETPGLSGGEAQRLKLASEMGKGQKDSVFVFDEPTIGLHPQDVRTLLDVFQSLIDLGATVIVIEHDLDVIRNADYIIDMGPGGGLSGGRIIAEGTPEDIRGSTESLTGQFI
ncbi:excinuclease ABC subunit UvrA, partial [Pyramidobacter sp.]